MNYEAALDELVRIIASGYVRMLSARSDTEDRLAADSRLHNPLDSPGQQSDELVMEPRRRTRRG